MTYKYSELQGQLQNTPFSHSERIFKTMAKINLNVNPTQNMKTTNKNTKCANQKLKQNFILITCENMNMK